MAKPLRIVCLDGPGDAIASFMHWRNGADNPGVTHVTFSGQFYDVCQSLGAAVKIVGENTRIERIEDGNFVIEHRGNPSIGKRGAAYHLAELAHARRVLPEIVRFGADVVVMGNRPYPFVMHALRPLGIKVVLTLHCVLWLKFSPPSSTSQIIHQLDGSFYRRGCSALLCVSEDIKRQVRQVAGGQTAPFVDFLPSFRSSTFSGITPPDHRAKPFRVMFAGRIERDKGVFDLLHIAKRLRERGRRDIVFELCGMGSAVDALKTEVADAGVESTFTLRGWCDHEQMRESFARSHVVIVPSTTSFPEGFTMTVVEALLAQRPVISSPVCPALEYVPGAVMVVPPDDLAAYETAILELADNESRYQSLQRMSVAAGQPFLSEATSYRSAMEHTLGAIARGERVTPREISVSSR